MKRLYLHLALALAFLLELTVLKTASAQEILLEGPLAGAPAVRKLVQYREMRGSLGPMFGYTINNDYVHNILIGGRLEFNIFEWLGVGGVILGAVNVTTQLTDHISSSGNIGGASTTPSDSNFPSYTGASNFKNQVGRLKGMYLAQISLIPFRGKLSMFEKLFLGIDGAIFVGGGVVRFEERKYCSGSECGDYKDDEGNILPPSSYAPEREKKAGGAFTFGAGFMAYFNNWFAVNIEYRMTPFKWNPSGMDEAGQAGSQWVFNEQDERWEVEARGKKGDYPDGKIDDQDRQWNLNQSIALGFIFHFPFEPRISE